MHCDSKRRQKSLELYGWNGLKSQKFIAQGNGYKQHALKGQKLLAQGSALGIVTVRNATCNGKSFINFRVSFKAFALTGRQVCEHNNPGRCPGLRASAPSGRATSMSFCLLPLPYPSASDFQFPSAGDRWFMVYWVISTIQVEITSLTGEK